MRDAVIVEAVRTPVGRRGGALSGVHPVDLSAHVLGALAERSGIDPVLVDDVVWGCVQQVGDQADNIARNAVLSAGWPESVPGTSVDRQCGSSQQSVHFAAAGLVSGQYEVVVAGVLEVRAGQAGGAGRWTRTSDLARVDEDGFLWIEGRADDVIIRGGFKVHPSTVAAVLERHPAVAEAAVAGIPDERLGQVPVAAFEVRPGADVPGDAELRTWCRRELLPYEVPVRFLHVPELPRGVSQKVNRVDLVALFE
jgi:acyl-CoA synthetase (AMP-forming)/AMP-acid ligase II